MSHSLSILPADVAITFAIQFVIVIFLFVAFLLLVVKFFKLSYRALAALVSSLSFSLPIRLISLSIATWLFPELPKFILFLLFNLFSFFFIAIFPRHCCLASKQRRDNASQLIQESA